MNIKEISASVFDEFVNNHILKNFYQTSYYGKFMDNSKYSTMYVGAYHNDTLVAASLILYKFIAPTIKYGYAPRGFILDYTDIDLLESFTSKIKSFFLLKNFAFIKINPEIIHSRVDYNENKKYINSQNNELITYFKDFGYEKLRDNLYFESMLPKYNPIINLNNFTKESVNDNCLKKIDNTTLKSLALKKCSEKELSIFFEFVKNKTKRTLKYYTDFYNYFKENDSVDLLMVEIDYHKHLDNYRIKYERASIENENINDLFNDNPSDTELLQKKMKSDRELSEIKHTIDTLNNRIKTGVTKELIGGALLIRYKNRVNLVISGFDEDLTILNANYYLYYNFIMYYKNLNYVFLDLNGITGDNTPNNPYKSLNEFKLSFNPTVYEYIGEFDLVINNPIYNMLWKSGKLENEFKN